MAAKGVATEQNKQAEDPVFPASGARVRRGMERVGKESWWLEFVDGDRTKQIADGEGAHHRSTIGDDA